jgi:hypothetical protein
MSCMRTHSRSPGCSTTRWGLLSGVILRVCVRAHKEDLGEHTRHMHVWTNTAEWTQVPVLRELNVQREHPRFCGT